MALIIFPSISLAQMIDTNRPGFTFSAAVVDPGQWQLETGFDYVRGNGSARSWSLPVAEVRLGIVDRLEFFLNGISWGWQDSGSTQNNGFKDMGVGLKYNLTGSDSAVSTALLAQLSVPVGDSEFTSDRWDPAIAFIWASNSAVPLAGTFKVSKFESGYQLDNGLKWAFPMGDSVTTFIEWEANMPEAGGDTHWMNLGFQLLRSSDTQLDLSAGVGLNRAADDYRLGIGFSHRF